MTTAFKRTHIVATHATSAHLPALAAPRFGAHAAQQQENLAMGMLMSLDLAQLAIQLAHLVSQQLSWV